MRIIARADVTVRDMGQIAALYSPQRRGAHVPARVVDAVVATLLLAGALGALASLHSVGSTDLAVSACLLVSIAVAARRRNPLAAAFASLVGLVGYELATHDPNSAFPPVAVVLTFYMLGRATNWRRQAVGRLLAAALALSACAVISADQHGSAATALSSWLVVALAPLAAGAGVARRAQLTAQLAVTAALLRAEQHLNATQASSQERNRVARELHDVVTHCVSVMVIQAGGARLIAERDPAEADQALAVIGGCGREALADLRRIVGVLDRGVDPDFGCGAGLADLARLTERMRLAGVPTSTTVEGDIALPPAVDVVAYRVAQEALTNVVKHAGAGATAAVHVYGGPHELVVEVTDTGRVGAGAPPPTSGHGLVGMRERVTAYGGDLRSGPQSGGGYSVTARIPLHTSQTASSSLRGSRERLPRPWLRPVGETLIVCGWLVAMELEAATSSARHGSWAGNAAAVGVMALAALGRRRNPLLFLAVVGALAAALSDGLTSLDRSTITGLYSLAVPLFTAAAWQTRARATLGIALWTAGASIVAITHHEAIGGLAGALVMGLVVWTAGLIWRSQRVLNAELAETTAKLATERDHRIALAVASERTRIARELHSLVAQGVVTMVVQADAARNLLARQPDAAVEAIRAIERTGRDALTQLRRILGVLRARIGTTDEANGAAPGPSPTPTPLPEQLGAHLPEKVLT